MTPAEAEARAETEFARRGVRGRVPERIDTAEHLCELKGPVARAREQAAAREGRRRGMARKPRRRTTERIGKASEKIGERDDKRIREHLREIRERRDEAFGLIFQIAEQDRLASHNRRHPGLRLIEPLQERRRLRAHRFCEDARGVRRHCLIEKHLTRHRRHACNTIARGIDHC